LDENSPVATTTELDIIAGLITAGFWETDNDSPSLLVFGSNWQW
jgi:hypothetical protein